MHTLAKGGSQMINCNGLLQNKNICVEFRQIQINEKGIFWAADFTDYSSEKIIIIPEDPFFKPTPYIKYIAIRPKGFEQVFAQYNGLPVHKAKILKIILSRVTEKNISIYKCNFYVPKCALDREELCVFLRRSTGRNLFSMIWIKDEELRKKIYDHLVDVGSIGANLEKNSFGAITMEGKPEENITDFEERIINVINNHLKG